MNAKPNRDKYLWRIEYVRVESGTHGSCVAYDNVAAFTIEEARRMVPRLLRAAKPEFGRLKVKSIACVDIITN